MSKLSLVACQDPRVQLVFSPCCLVFLEAPCQGPTATDILCQPSFSLAGEGKIERGNQMLCEQALYFPFSPHTAEQVSCNTAVAQ